MCGVARRRAHLEVGRGLAGGVVHAPVVEGEVALGGTQLPPALEVRRPVLPGEAGCIVDVARQLVAGRGGEVQVDDSLRPITTRHVTPRHSNDISGKQ